ncbi:alpha/beta fold hydrolase [Actinomycetospora sp. OC33-EN08]|uniref:Alpha/beta fold hydrolase n=1 Tax=Actinomycetospora aurantiaca TaxID=3129233 RepID=A0ABU8MSX8_9PSEU
MSQTSSDTWIRRYHPTEAPVRLVCFPHAGGSASFYHPVSAQLTPAIDVVAVQYPGRQDRRTETAFTDVVEHAEAISAALRGWDDRPLAFFGHSMGALLAFEVTRVRERTGEPVPQRLFLSGRRAPSVYLAEDLPTDDDGVIAKLRELAGTNPAILGDPELMRMALPALRADYTAVDAYRPGDDVSVDVPLDVLTGDADDRTRIEDARAWERHTTAGSELTVFPGGHFFLADRAPEVLALVRERLSGVTV